MLRKVVNVNDDIIQIQFDLRSRIDSVVKNARTIERNAMLTTRREPKLSKERFNAVKRSVAELARARTTPGAEPLLKNLRSVVANAEVQIQNSEQVYLSLANLGDEADALRSAMAEMARLEERMQAIIETGSQLVGRLRPCLLYTSPSPRDS